MEKKITNNVVSMAGELATPFCFSHEVFGEKFYTSTLNVPRLSERLDNLIIMISDRLIDTSRDMTGTKIRISGQFRSYNRNDGVRNRLALSLFVREVERLNPEADINEIQNEIYLNGYICKPPIYRKTPLGREIADIILAVNRPYGKSDYIPCITWGRNARFSSGLRVGTQVELWGRVQSREYIKKISDTETEGRVAFEVSVSRINEVPYFGEIQENASVSEE